MHFISRNAAQQQLLRMDTDGDEGVWSVTIGPLPTEIWIYNFRIEGIDFPDPANISLMPRSAGPVAVSSFVEVPGDAPANRKLECCRPESVW
jgi:hypothetical protein